MIYLSQVLGRPILDLEGERVATLKDVIVRLGEGDHPPAAGFVARYRRRDFLFRAGAGFGAVAEVEPLVDELCRLSPEFKAMWRDNDVRSHGEGVKHIRHPILGPVAFEYSAFAVDGRPDLCMVVYNPATPADAEKIRSLTGD